jgi:hypothetical protein
MRKGEALILVLALGGTALAGWHYRADIKAHFDRLAVQQQAGSGTQTAASPPDTLYTWVDSDGITHYEQQPGGAGSQALQYDGSRITPLVPPEQQGGSTTAAAGQSPTTRAEVMAGAVAGQGKETLHQLRQELEENARRMQEAKAAANDL